MNFSALIEKSSARLSTCYVLLTVLQSQSSKERNMRWLPTILLCLLFSFSVHSQEVITKTLAGPNDDQFRIAIAFMSQGDDNSYKLQSFILDINRVKKNEQPTSFYLDLTTTVRNLTTGAKKQKILVERWKTS